MFFLAHVAQPISYCYLEQDVDDDDEEGEGNVEKQPDLNGLDGCSWRPALQVLCTNVITVLVHLAEMDR